MKTVPGYPKIWSLGSFPQGRWGDPLAGELVIQEKVDGSQFGFGINEAGALVFRSKGVSRLDLGPEGDGVPDQFGKAVDHILAQEAVLRRGYSAETYFYAEAITKPKHNTLVYGRVPQGCLVLFDAWDQEGWFERHHLENAAARLDLDVIPELYRGPADRDRIASYLDRPSFLEGTTQEGVVVKNYGVLYELYGHTFPAYLKLVREDFKERNDRNWAPGSKDAVAEYASTFANPNRWKKALQYLGDSGQVTKTPRDISQLFARVNADIEEECGADIREELYRLFRKPILRGATRGLPEWYRALLAEEGVVG